MKIFHLFFAMALLMLVFHLFSFAQERGFGAGVLIGEPTGVSLKGWLSRTTALDAGVAWSFVKETSFHIHADYLIHSFNIFRTSEDIPLYYGIGGRIKTGRHEDTRVGLRMVLGIAYLFRKAPFDIFMEAAPILDLVPETTLRANAGIGARFFFR